jgi:hypothetical protein
MVRPLRGRNAIWASVSVGFTYGYSRCPAPRDANGVGTAEAVLTFTPIGLAPGLAELGSHAGLRSGSAAPPCGKPPAFRPMPAPLSFSAQAGRLSLPACAEEVVQGADPSERRSLSANQAAEPQVLVDPSERILDKPGACPGQRKGKPWPLERESKQGTRAGARGHGQSLP